MRKQRLYPLIVVLILVVFFSLALRCMGIQLGPATMEDKIIMEDLGEDPDEYDEWPGPELDQAAPTEEVEENTEEEKQTEIKQTEAAEEVTEESAVSEDKRAFPDEPVTYYEINECPITLTVDFKTAQITGLMKNPPYDDVIFTDGKIDLDNLEIYTSAPQVTDKDSSGNITETTVLTITGKISDDFSTLNGVISNSAGASEEFTATR